jgi:hypothetical protein
MQEISCLEQPEMSKNTGVENIDNNGKESAVNTALDGSTYPG